jgi:hypothetical protein
MVAKESEVPRIKDSEVRGFVPRLPRSGSPTTHGS